MSVSRRLFLSSSAAPLLLAAPFDERARSWNARWIVPPAAPPTEPLVCHFRRKFRLEASPAGFSVHVSGDSRYQLFCNGVKVSSGPARGDLNHWRYETVDLAPHLRPGDNLLAAVVWNDGPHAAIAQWSHRTAFVLQAGDTTHEPLVNTGPAWRCTRNAAYQPVPVPTYQETGYYAIGPMERFDASKHPWGWERLEFDDSAWQPAEAYRNASPRDLRDAPTRWMLVPRPIPPMEETPQRLAKVRRSQGVEAPAGFPSNPEPFDIPANSRAELLLDQGHLTCAYPVLAIRGGKDARITLAYTEALFQEMKPRRRKGNRNEVEGKTFIGYADTVVADGQPRTWSPLYWRTFRYLRLTVETAAEPLTISGLSSVYTGYPFVAKARFDSGVPLHKEILEIGWRTARLCAHETYMDCPYYEQLQYVGDTRIQAIVSLFMTGDARLMRNAIEQIDSSRTAEGATYSRAPSVLQQYIPGFSLWWIGMVRDYWWYVDEPSFVRQMLPGVRAVLAFYSRYLRQDGLLGPMPWWNYVDWLQKWQNGRPPSEPEIMPATIHFQLLLALQWAAELEAALGSSALAAEFSRQASSLAGVICARFYDPARKLFSEDLAHKEFSQHANSLAVLAAVVKDAEAADIMQRIWNSQDIHRCSVYFRYYLDRAMVEAGLGDLYTERLQTWEFMLSEGLTTFAEVDNPFTRSDCHAWSASPNAEFFRTILGVDSAAPGFAKVRVRPNLGKLGKVSGVVPHPKGGLIEVTVTRTAGKLQIDARVPPGVELIR